MDYHHLRLPILEARVDWITCTAPRGDAGAALAQLGERELEGEVVSGDQQRPWSFQGYHGFSAGDARWGWGREGAIVVCSQQRAQDIAPELARVSAHWSRVDYCVTVLDENDEVHPDVDWWDTWNSRHPRGGGAVRLTRLQTFGGGATVYLGTRASAAYLRCYDKYAESHGDYPKGSWRFELELKREQSETARQRWATSHVSSGYIADVVAQYPQRHGLECPWSTEGLTIDATRVYRRRDADRLLAWFRTQVAPSVEFVASARGRDAVRDALNI